MYRRAVRSILVVSLVLSLWAVVEPSVALAAPLSQEGGQEYVVRAGDSLSRIAMRFYGDASLWPDIYYATNAKNEEDPRFLIIADPNILYTGQRLWVPSMDEPMPAPAPVDEQVGAEGAEAADEAPSVVETVPASESVDDQAAVPEAEAAEEGPNVALAPLGELGAEGGALAEAAGQMELALQHLGFLQSELEGENLEGAQQHAEHVVNILEGEGGLFGDHDRDGQLQNPGDGIGVRGHLDDAGVVVASVVAAVAEDGGAGELQSSVEELATGIEGDGSLAQEAVERIFQIFAADTVEEAQVTATDGAVILEGLQEAIDSVTADIELLVQG